MEKQAIDKTARELFSDSKSHALLALYCCIFAIVKALREGYNGVRTFVLSRVWMAYNCVAGAYLRWQRAVFVFWSSLGWSLSMSLFALNLYA
jgi:hypothetical protein